MLPHRLTADKRLCFTIPKLLSATSFIRETLYAMPCSVRNVIKNEAML